LAAWLVENLVEKMVYKRVASMADVMGNLWVARMEILMA
jgi:hypothetical protein